MSGEAPSAARRGRFALIGPTERTRYTIRVDLSIETVFAAITDFGPIRSSVWRETSHPRTYAVHHLDAQSAEVTEGVPFSWSREQYEWEEPTVVSLTQIDSNVARNGLIRYELRRDFGGTVVMCDRYREFYGFRGRVAGTLMTVAGAAILERQLRAGLERYDNAKESSES